MIQLSIITINYNNAKGLQKTIESVVSQNYKNIEYIIIDGGSKDNSVDVIKEHEDIISYWVSERDSGIYNAMNKGIQKATGEYLLFLNSGDSLVCETVLEQLIKGEKGDTDLVYGDLIRTFSDGTQDFVEMPDFITVDRMMTQTLCHPVTLIHSRLFQEFGLYDERLKIVADWAFFFKVIVHGNATQKHKKVTVANFMMDGLSSLPESRSKINEEKDWVKMNYSSPAFIKLYQEYSIYKSLYHNKWMQRLRRVKRAVNKIKG